MRSGRPISVRPRSWSATTAGDSSISRRRRSTCSKEIVDAVGDRLEVILDGGVRRGTHILKALALGARACSAGRPHLYGLGAGGEAGVVQALKILKTELARDMALLGVAEASRHRFEPRSQSGWVVGDIDDAARAAAVDAARSTVRRFRGGELGLADDPDLVATEEPFEIRLGYSRRDGSRAEEPVSVTMRTPGHDEDLAVGFLFTEGIIRARSDVQSVVARGQRAADGLINVVRVELTPGVEVNFKRLERNFYMTSSCGVCGKASIEAVAVQGQYDVGAADLRMPGAALGRLARGAEDPAGRVRADGRLARVGSVRCDGHDRRAARGRRPAQRARQADRQRVAARASAARRAWRHRQRPRELRAHAKSQDGRYARSSRPSGAPSSLAVELAREFGITLVGFLKADRFNVYSRPDRIV